MNFEDCLYELNYIIENMDEEIRNRIPLSIRREIKSKMSDNLEMLLKDYELEDFSEETKAYLSVLYSEYVCLEKTEKDKWRKIDELFETSSKN